MLPAQGESIDQHFGERHIAVASMERYSGAVLQRSDATRWIALQATLDPVSALCLTRRKLLQVAEHVQGRACRPLLRPLSALRVTGQSRLYSPSRYSLVQNVHLSPAAVCKVRVWSSLDWLAIARSLVALPCLGVAWRCWTVVMWLVL